MSFDAATPTEVRAGNVHVTQIDSGNHPVQVVAPRGRLSLSADDARDLRNALLTLFPLGGAR